MQNPLLNILVVEDDEAHLELITRAFQSSPGWAGRFRIASAGRLSEAKAWLSCNQPDLVIADWRLPDGEGTSILDSRDEVPRFPLVLMTSFGNERLAVEAIKAGVLEYIVKSTTIFRELPRIAERVRREWHSLVERKQTADELRFANTILQAQQEASPDGILVVDDQRRVVSFNQRFVEMWGIPDEVIQTRSDEATLDAAQRQLLDPEAFRAKVEYLYQHTDEKSSDEIRLTGGRTFERFSAPIMDPNGTCYGRVWYFRDITPRRQAEESLRVSEERLLHVQKLDAIGKLAGGIAHDFNNMLSVIIGFAEVSLKMMNPMDPLRPNIESIVEAADRSADITRKLLAFARKQTVAPCVVNLNEAISSIRTMLERLIGEDVKLTVKACPDLWPILIDPSQLDQILANLATNARDAIDDVGTITIETDNVTVEAEYCRTHLDAKPGEYVRLKFSDTGRGMDHNTLEQVFEPFFTTKPVGKGTGLGLPTVYGIVKQNEGFILIDTQPAQGTAFSLFFPRHAQIAVVQPKKVETQELRGDETILVVEDEEQILKLARISLERCGYRVIPAGDPGAALLACEKYEGPIQVLLTDVVMPLMNGRDLKARIERLKPGIRTIFMSGYTSDAILTRGIVDEGVHFIQKPFNPTKLAAKIREVLNS